MGLLQRRTYVGPLALEQRQRIGAGVQRGEVVPAVLFFAVALLGALGLWRLLRTPRPRG